MHSAMPFAFLACLVVAAVTVSGSLTTSSMAWHSAAMEELLSEAATRRAELLRENVTLIILVSPKGNDTNNGVSAPVRTFPGAIAAAQRLRRQNTTVPVWIAAEPAVYELDSPLELGPNESNLIFTPLILNNEPTPVARTILSGGRRVVLHQVAGSPQLYRAQLPRADFPQQHVWQVWSPLAHGLHRRFMNAAVNGTARYDIINTTSPVSIATSGAVRAGLGEVDVSEAFCYVYHSWTSSLARVGSFDAATGTLTFATQMPDNVYNTASGRRFRVVNAWPKSGLLEPGCFFFNATSRDLFYRPDELDTVVNGTVLLVVPRLPTVVRGMPGNNNTWLVNLTIAATDSYLEDSCLATSCDGQSATAVTAAGLSVTGATRFITQGLTIAHHGGFGVHVGPDCQEIISQNITVADTGAGGIRIGAAAGGAAPSGVTEKVIIYDSDIRDGGHVVESGPGIMVQQASIVLLRNNAVHDFYYTGISLGWTWSYGPTSTHRIIVLKNRIYNIGKGRLSDMGCVYTLGDLTPTVVENNICHDVQSYGYGGNGLYTDQASTGVTFVSNIVYRVKDSLLLQHWGLNNRFINNVLAFNQQLDSSIDTPSGQYSAIFAAQPEGMPSSFDFKNNIVLLRNRTAALFIESFPTALLNSTFNRNCYWNTEVAASDLTFPTATANQTFAAWQKLGKDTESVVADPRFKHADQYDFSSLYSDSPCVLLGFLPIDTTNVGPPS